jgi:hypothetical protein
VALLVVQAQLLVAQEEYQRVEPVELVAHLLVRVVQVVM